MKKKLIFTSASTLLLFLFVLSCADEYSESILSRKHEPIIEDAKLMYQTFTDASVEMRSVKELESMLIKPSWEHTRVQENAKYQVVEIMLLSEKGFSYVTPEALEKYEQTEDMRYRLSKTSFVYRIDKKTKEEEMFLFTIVPDLDYLESTKFKPFKKNSYLKRDKGLSGLVFYHNMEGEFVNGWRYLDGQVISTIDAHVGKPEFDMVATRSCTNYYLEYLIEECWRWGLPNGEITGEQCRYYYQTVWWHTECSTGGSGSDGDYGGGGTGGGGPSGTPQGKATRENLIYLSHFDSEGEQRLLEAIDDMLKDCAYQYMFNNIGQHAFTLVAYDRSSGVSGYYDVQKQTYFVNSNDNIKNSFEEEFIHLYQNKTYTGGISQYANTGKPNIEFEARLLKDLVCIYNREKPCPCWGSGPLYSHEYENWLWTLTNHGNSLITYESIMSHQYDGLGYWDFMADFCRRDTVYNKPIKYDLDPIVIKKVLPHIKCN